MSFLRSWTLCNKLNHNDLDIRPKNLTIWQDFTKNSYYEEEYCKKEHVQALKSQCNENGNVIEEKQDDADLDDPNKLHVPHLKDNDSVNTSVGYHEFILLRRRL